MTLTEALAAPAPDYPTLTCAMACADCSAIFRSGDACPYCRSAAVMNLAAVLTPHPCAACGVSRAVCAAGQGSCCMTCVHEREAA